jgi:hypothetical protein
MQYPITPSAERIRLSPDLALSVLLSSWDYYTAHDIGSHLTCHEAEALADLFAAHERHDLADALREGHVDSDDGGDMNHNTGEEFTDAELEAMKP